MGLSQRNKNKRATRLMKAKFFLFLFYFCMVGALITFFYGLDDYYSVTVLPSSEEDIVQSCSNLSLEQTATCLEESIRPFYKYRENPDNNTLTFRQILLEGGDCRDYSLLYESLGQGLGFYNEGIKIDVTIDSAHRIAILSDSTGYCILDQLVKDCVTFPKGL